VVTDLQDDLGREVVDGINAEIGAAVAAYLPLDVTDFKAWRGAVEGAVERFGKLTSLVNNAGAPARGKVDEVEIEAWQRTMDINVNGTFYGMKAALPELRKNSTSSIVNVSSIAGLVGFK